MKPTGIQRKAMGEPDNSPRPLLVEIKERLNHTIRAFNDKFGNVEWKDADKIQEVIA